MKFKDLKIGQSFDWIDDGRPAFNSFFYRCIKISPRKYMSGETVYRVGSINAEVHHVE